MVIYMAVDLPIYLVLRVM